MHFNKSAVSFPICASNNRLAHFFKNWRGNIDAATAIEYAMIAAAISLAIVVVVFTIGEELFVNMYQNLADMISSQS